MAFRSFANHLVQQEVETQMKTQDTFSQQSYKQLSLIDLLESSSKMSLDSSVQNLEEMDGQTQKGLQYSSMSLENWNAEVIKQRGEYSVRSKQAHLTREKESSSLQNWQTPTVMMPDESMENFQARKKKNGYKNGTIYSNLVMQVKDVEKKEAQKNWPTPNTMDVMPPKSQEALDRNRKKGGCSNLREWIHHEGTYQYKEQKNWPTPRAFAAMTSKITPENSLNPARFANLETIVGRVAFKGIGQEDLDKNNATGKNLELLLNPSWVEQLMGLTTGLSDLGCWGTE